MKILKLILLGLVVGDLMLGVGLYQPFQHIQTSGVVRWSNSLATLVQVNGVFMPYPSPNIVLQRGDEFRLTCNQGQWLPVLFDCIFSIDTQPALPSIEL